MRALVSAGATSLNPPLTAISASTGNCGASKAFMAPGLGGEPVLKSRISSVPLASRSTRSAWPVMVKGSTSRRSQRPETSAWRAATRCARPCSNSRNCVAAVAKRLSQMSRRSPMASSPANSSAAIAISRSKASGAAGSISSSTKRAKMAWMMVPRSRTSGSSPSASSGFNLRTCLA